MTFLTRTQAKMIVERMMKDIPYNINIMDEKGMIIGSGQSERIGMLHDGAVEAIQSKKTVIITENRKQSKKGTNEPIIFNGEVIGVVGISGDPEKVKPFAKIVKTTTILLIEQLQDLADQNIAEKRKNDFLLRLQRSIFPYNETLQKEAQQYGFDLRAPYQIICSDKRETIKEVNLTMAFTLTTDLYYGILAATDSAEIAQFGPKDIAGISSSTINFGQAVEQAKQAYLLKRILQFEQPIFHYESSLLLCFLTTLPLEVPREVTGTYQKLTELGLLETLLVFFKENANTTEAAKKLHVHRNTLQYRLNKIYEITNKDPKDNIQMLTLIYQYMYISLQ